MKQLPLGLDGRAEQPRPQTTNQVRRVTPDASAITWITPIDNFGRELPAIAAHGSDWGRAVLWGAIAVGAANELGPDATDRQLLEASTGTRWLFWSLTGERQLLEAEIARLQGNGADL
jgi:hypothetical protein